MLHVGHAIERDIMQLLAIEEISNNLKMKMNMMKIHWTNSRKNSSMSKTQYLNHIQEHNHTGKFVVLHQIQDQIRKIGKEIMSMKEAERKIKCIVTLAKVEITLAQPVQTSSNIHEL